MSATGTDVVEFMETVPVALPVSDIPDGRGNDLAVYIEKTMLEPPIAPASSCIPATVAVMCAPFTRARGISAYTCPSTTSSSIFPTRRYWIWCPSHAVSTYTRTFSLPVSSAERRIGVSGMTGCSVGADSASALSSALAVVADFHIRNGAVRVQRERSVGGEAPRRLRLPPPVGEQSVPHAHDEIVQHVSMEQDIQDEADMEVKQQPDGIRENSTNAAIIQP